jgi:DNA (cytosine-5)-methyltransferase 1
LNELSLFTGTGGGELGTQHLLGWRTIGYVEWDEYCQRVLAQRIKDELLDEAPIFGDINAFIGEGYAERYRGMVDVLTAGFPCQPFSVAGKQGGEQDERNMWPQTVECIRIIRPRYALLENVPGLLANEYIRRIFGDLAEAGYDARWCVLGADDCGAPHRRKRLWIMAQPKGGNAREQKAGNGREGARRGSKKIPDPKAVQREEIIGSKQNGVLSEDVSYPETPIWWRTDPADDPWRWHQEIRGQGESATKEEYGAVEPRLGRVAHGVAHRVDRLKAIGNGQVPAVVRAVWQILNGEGQDGAADNS